MNEIPDLPNFDIGDIGLKGLDLDFGAFDLGGENRTVETRYGTIKKSVRASALFDLITTGGSDGERK